MQRVDDLLPVGFADMFQVISAIRDPTLHQVITPEQYDALFLRHLAQHLQIRLLVDLGRHRFAELRVDQHQIRAAGAYLRDAGFQHLSQFGGRNVAQGFHCAGLPQHQRKVLLDQFGLDQLQHFLRGGTTRAAQRQPDLPPWQFRPQALDQSIGKRVAAAAILADHGSGSDRQHIYGVLTANCLGQMHQPLIGQGKFRRGRAGIRCRRVERSSRQENRRKQGEQEQRLELEHRRNRYQPGGSPARSRIRPVLISGQASNAKAAACTSSAAEQAGWRVSNKVCRRIASRTRSSRRTMPSKPGVRPRKLAQARDSVA